jgi:hypothetical protein
VKTPVFRVSPDSEEATIVLLRTEDMQNKEQNIFVNISPTYGQHNSTSGNLVKYANTARFFKKSKNPNDEEYRNERDTITYQ